MPEVLIYTTSYCGYCRAAKAQLESLGIDYREIDVTSDAQMRRDLIAKAEGRRTVPQIFIDGNYLGIADDFNGYPQTAKLPAGYYSVRVVAPDGRVEERRIYVAVGQEYNYNYKFR